MPRIYRWNETMEFRHYKRNERAKMLKRQEHRRRIKPTMWKIAVYVMGGAVIGLLYQILLIR